MLVRTEIQLRRGYIAISALRCNWNWNSYKHCGTGARQDAAKISLL